MKEVLLFSVLTFLLTQTVSAQTITEGKSSVNTSVTTNVNSSSNNSSDSKSETKTHIEIEVNGEKKVLDTNEPGTHTLSIEKDGGKSSATVRINNSSSAASAGSSGEPKEEDPGDLLDDDGEIIGSNAQEADLESKTIIQKILEEIRNFFEKLLDF